MIWYITTWGVGVSFAFTIPQRPISDQKAINVIIAATPVSR